MLLDNLFAIVGVPGTAALLLTIVAIVGVPAVSSTLCPFAFARRLSRR